MLPEDSCLYELLFVVLLFVVLLFVVHIFIIHDDFSLAGVSQFFFTIKLVQ